MRDPMNLDEAIAVLRDGLAIIDPSEDDTPLWVTEAWQAHEFLNDPDLEVVERFDTALRTVLDAVEGDRWEERLAVANAALRAIAENRIPCSRCGNVHEERDLYPERRDTRGAIIRGRLVTWADPADGHAYHPMTPRQYAQSVIDDILT